eukprot:913679-Pelagomonas_calceolata.AAC.1
MCSLTTCVKQQSKEAKSELMPNTIVVCAETCRRDGRSPEVLMYAQMQVHTHNELYGTLNKNDHTAAVNVQQTVRTNCP